MSTGPNRQQTNPLPLAIIFEGRSQKLTTLLHTTIAIWVSRCRRPTTVYESCVSSVAGGARQRPRWLFLCPFQIRPLDVQIRVLSRSYVRCHLSSSFGHGSALPQSQTRDSRELEKKNLSVRIRSLSHRHDGSGIHGIRCGRHCQRRRMRFVYKLQSRWPCVVGKSVLCTGHSFCVVCRNRTGHFIQHHLHQDVWMLHLLLLPLLLLWDEDQRTRSGFS